MIFWLLAWFVVGYIVLALLLTSALCEPVTLETEHEAYAVTKQLMSSVRNIGDNKRFVVVALSLILSPVIWPYYVFNFSK